MLTCWCITSDGGINMTKTKTYNFDKEYLVLNEMSASYLYSEKPFFYYDSSRHSGKPCPKTKNVPFWGKVQFQKKLDHSKHKGNRIYTYKCNIYCDHACIVLSNIILEPLGYRESPRNENRKPEITSIFITDPMLFWN